MGERNGTLYYSDGVPVGEFPAITLDDKPDGKEVAFLAATALSGDIAVTRQHTTCKTRKRFVKLLMSNGHSRNEANRLAERIRGRYSYQEYYYCLNPVRQFFKTRTVSGNAKRQ